MIRTTLPPALVRLSKKFKINTKFTQSSIQDCIIILSRGPSNSPTFQRSFYAWRIVRVLLLPTWQLYRNAVFSSFRRASRRVILAKPVEYGLREGHFIKPVADLALCCLVQPGFPQPPTSLEKHICFIRDLLLGEFRHGKQTTATRN